MNCRHVVVILCLSSALFAGSARGQDVSAYRGVHLGDDVQRVVQATGVSPTDVRVIHQRPVLMQQLEWRMRSMAGPTGMNDPVQRVVFSFYRDQVYRIFVTYERARIDGLTNEDLLESMSAAYGTPDTSDAAKVLGPSETPDGGGGADYRVVARWETADQAIVLVRGGYLVPLSLVMLAKHVAADARHADAEASRLEVSERPARDALKATRDAEAQRLAQEKVRPANKAAFKP
jgi:hypothetical protein